MPEKHRIAKPRRDEDGLTDLHWDFLNDELPHKDPRRWAAETNWQVYELTTNRKLADVDARPCSDLWARFGAEIVERWIADYPGTRPSCWWRFEGPDGPDAMARAAPPISQQPRRLEALGLLTDAEAGWRTRAKQPPIPSAVRKPGRRLTQISKPEQ